MTKDVNERVRQLEIDKATSQGQFSSINASLSRIEIKGEASAENLKENYATKEDIKQIHSMFKIGGAILLFTLFRNEPLAKDVLVKLITYAEGGVGFLLAYGSDTMPSATGNLTTLIQ